MKQSKTEKAVFAKLSTQKVELNAMTDVLDAEREVVEVIKLIDTYDFGVTIRQMNQHNVNLEAHQSNIERGNKNLDDKLSELVQISKKIGIEVTKLDEYKQGLQALEDGKGALRTVKRMIKALDKSADSLREAQRID